MVLMVAATVSEKKHSNPKAALGLGVRLRQASDVRRIRPMWQFAEEEIVLPNGQYPDMPFRCDRQPWTRVLFDELDNSHWYSTIFTGPNQIGKTVCAFVIPFLHTVCELGEHTGVAAPEEGMIADKWTNDIVPIMNASASLQRLIPDSGFGAKGGRIREIIEFPHGVNAKLFSRGGKDSNKSGFPLRFMHMTEAAGFSQGTTTSKEGGPLRQLYRRLRGHKRRNRRFRIEGTLQTEDELPWTLRGEESGPLISSCSRLVSPCPHCEKWICPEREHLVGWENAETEDEAGNQATYICPECSCEISDEQRIAAHCDVKIIHAGQAITKKGKIRGPLPPVHTLWFRTNYYNNCLQEAGDAAVEEWQAAQHDEDSEEREELEKELCQAIHAIPYKPKKLEEIELVQKDAKKRQSEYEQNVLPPDTTHLVVAIDPGMYTMWYSVMAATAGGLFVIVSYGAVDVVLNDNKSIESRLPAALRDLFSTVCDRGWVVADSRKRKTVDRVWIDIGDWPDIIAPVIYAANKASGLKMSQRRYRACRGRGKSQIEKYKYNHPEKPTDRIRQIGLAWYATLNRKRRIMESTFNADHWKLWAQGALVVEEGQPGSLVFYRSEDRQQHNKIAYHHVNERYVTEGRERKWKTFGQNHWLDCSAMCGAGLDHAGFEFLALPNPEKGEPAKSFRDRLREAG